MGNAIRELYNNWDCNQAYKVLSRRKVRYVLLESIKAPSQILQKEKELIDQAEEYIQFLYLEDILEAFKERIECLENNEKHIDILRKNMDQLFEKKQNLEMRLRLYKVSEDKKN
jgi:hypothetical protein|tara:strand:+ start:6430 stop:6771 length:342 start_codon:yes stop_codon:yes gene_type:complete